MGPIERSVRKFLNGLSQRDKANPTVDMFAQMALRLSKDYDASQDVDPTKLVRLNMELRQTLQDLRSVVGLSDDDDSGSDDDGLSTPQWGDVSPVVRDST